MGLQQVGDGKTVTVTAKITDIGKTKLLTDPAGFEITQFALADDEIDYRLWNSSHDNGSEYYGEAIENMPLLEPVTNNNFELNSMLSTGYSLTNYRLPYWVHQDGNTVTFTEKDGPGHVIKRNLTLENGKASKLHVHVPDSRYLTIEGTGMTPLASTGYTGNYGRKKNNIVHSENFLMDNSGIISVRSKMNDTGVTQVLTIRITAHDAVMKTRTHIKVSIPPYKNLSV
tara:strand:+ start:86 stop:769 length:684 start_codon:yes stop_codon:yes gene_type:complete